MQKPSKIEQQVMAGVATVYAARQLTGTTALKFYILVLSVWGVGRLVWVSHVFQNWANVGWEGTGQFVSYAVLHARMPVQLLLIVAAAAAIAFAIDLVRSSTPSRTLAY